MAITNINTLDIVDEDCALLAADDWHDIVPPGQSYAKGTDGAFVAGSPWTLTSALTDFAARGLAPGHVVHVEGPVPVAGNPARTDVRPYGLFGVAAVAANAVTLRGLGQPAGVGSPPVPDALAAAGVTGCRFVAPYAVGTNAQLVQAARWVRLQFRITQASDVTAAVEDDVKYLTILKALWHLYSLAAMRTGDLKKDDYAAKAKNLMAEVNGVGVVLSQVLGIYYTVSSISSGSMLVSSGPPRGAELAAG